MSDPLFDLRGSQCDPLQYPDENLTEYVFRSMGDRCVASTVAIPTAFIYGLILILGVFGNVCTCIVIMKNKTMHNPTNYYLFSLAISDLLMLILGLPVELYEVFVPSYPTTLGVIACKSRAFLIEFTSYASVLTITCFSIERWLAICFPLKAQLFSTLDRAIRVIIGVWIIAFLAATPVLFIVVINKVALPDDAPPHYWNDPLVTTDGRTVVNTDSCSMDNNRMADQKKLVYFSFFFFFLLPAMLISIVYCHIVVKLNTADGYIQAANRSSCRKNIKNRRSVLKILVAVVLMFFICWVPFHVQRLMTIYLNERDPNLKGPREDFIFWIWTLTFYISGCCYYSNSACNPILYNILSEKYRIAFCQTILGQRFATKLFSLKNATVRRQNTVSQKQASKSSAHIEGNEQHPTVTTKLLGNEKDAVRSDPVVACDSPTL